MRGHFGPLVFVGSNFVIFVLALAWRWPYLDQIPVHDLDVTTSVAVMWARSWFWEGPLALGFATTYAPLSVETSTLELRRPYESWPPGLLAPIYLTAVVLNTEPSVAMVNWINVVGHGLVSLFLSGAAYVLCRYNGWSRSSSGLIAAAVPAVALLPRGPAWFFSQIYTYDPHVLVFVSLFILLECCYHYVNSERARRWLTVGMLALGLWGCLVDWLMYFVLAVWIVGRFIGERKRLVMPMHRLAWIAAIATPLVGFALFLWWRLSLPGSLMETAGLRATFVDLLFKVTYRVGLQSDWPIPVPFGPYFWHMHRHFFSPIAPWMLAGSGIVIGVLLVSALIIGRASGGPNRKALYVTLLVACLVTLPVYGQIMVFRQHSVIHSFSIAKVLMPYAFLPFVIAPLLLGHVIDRFKSLRSPTVIKTVIALIAIGASLFVSTHAERPYLVGRIDPERMLMFEAIRRNVGFRDVVFTPDSALEAKPFKVEAGISNKVIYRVQTFAEVDPVVRRVCGPFNVVIVFKVEPRDGTWQGRVPQLVVRDSGLTLFKYVDYAGAAEGCS